MNEQKKLDKEAKIIAAAEEVFARLGFANAKMQDIAAEAGTTKVTLYNYFQSKENLYMAITYKALQRLNDKYYQVIDDHKEQSGLECTIALMECFINFCLDNYIHSEVLLHYFSLIRSSNNEQGDTKLTEAIRDSLYFLKLKDIHNIAFKLTAKQIQLGVEDGSIHADADPMSYTLQGWIMIIGYVKVTAASGKTRMSLFNVNLTDIKENLMQIVRHNLVNNH